MGVPPQMGQAIYGLPNSYYTDQAILSREISGIFRRTWQIVGREEDVRNIGDYLTCTVADEPLVVLRHLDGTLRALLNLCAHRGMRLLDGSGTCQRLTCPYHSWSYDLDGQLQRVSFPTYLPGDFDPSTVRLHTAQIDSWGGFIFVNLDPSADSLSIYLGDMRKRWEEYHPDWEGLREVNRLTYTQPFNWKIFMENSTDYYHIPFIHRRSLELPPVIRNCSSGSHFMLTTCTPEEHYERFFDLVFPNSYFHIGPNKIQHFQVVPDTADRCAIDIRLYQTPDQMKAYPLSDPTKHRDIAQILAEDFTICRVLQQQAKSAFFRVCYSAHELEAGVNHFDRIVLEHVRR